jgi:acyl-coenzyme A synthetase/AMP-(fatty) acid ligase
VPREIAVLDELPRGSTGKIVRAELQSKVSSQ